MDEGREGDAGGFREKGGFRGDHVRGGLCWGGLGPSDEAVPGGVVGSGRWWEVLELEVIEKRYGFQESCLAAGC